MVKKRRKAKKKSPQVSLRSQPVRDWLLEFFQDGDSVVVRRNDEIVFLAHSSSEKVPMYILHVDTDKILERQKHGL